MSALSRTIVAVPVLVAALLLGACSASPPPDLPEDAGDAGEVDPSSTPSNAEPDGIDIASLDACTILTQEDAETLIGTELTDPLSAATSDVSSCTYPGDPNGPSAQVEIYIGPGAKQQLDIDKDQLAHPFTEPTGIGDEAWQEDWMIFARTGDTWVSIRIVTSEEAAASLVPLQTAMTTALGRL